MMNPLLNLVSLWTWDCLVAITYKASVFTAAFPSKAALDTVILSVPFTFAPGLFDVLTSDALPTIEWLKALPFNWAYQWAVYLVVLEKPGCKPKIYMGKSTNAAEGCRSRFRNYKRLDALPMFVERALEKGYVITRLRLLCTTPIPPVHLRPRVSALFLALEAMFSFVFWAMVSKSSEYGYGGRAICPWNPDDFPWHGTCGHCSLVEAVTGLELSEEELYQQAEVRGNV